MSETLEPGLSLDLQIRNARDRAVLVALAQTGGHRKAAAGLLRIGVRTMAGFVADMRRRGLTVPASKPGRRYS